MIGLGKYALASTLATVGVIYHAYYTREQFYPAMLFLATSKISVVVLGNMAFVLTVLFGQLVKTVFLGTLREAEVERLYELSRHEIMETCLAMTIFRDEFNMSFLAMFTALLFVKIFHWLSQKRVEYIETTPSVSRLSHFRIVAFMGILLAVDCMFLHYAVTHAVSHILKQKRPSVLVLFAFEYMILASSTVATFLKYLLYALDVVMEGQWDNKAVYVFYLELIRDLFHLFVYLVFFLIVFAYYGLPLHLVRDLYETFRNFKARVADFIRYRRITSNLNDRFVDATPEELGRGDATCIICREEMSTAKKLPCGHLFHVHCLRSWLERQQTCPTCRSPLLPSEQEAAANAANGARQQPLQPGADAAQVVDGQVHGAAPPNLVPQYGGMGQNYGVDMHAQMQAAAAAAQLGMAGMYPVWRRINDPYHVYNPYVNQQQLQQNERQQYFMQAPFVLPVMPPMAMPGPDPAAANGNVNLHQPSTTSAGSQGGNLFGPPSPYPSLSDAQAQLAARMQMQATMAAAWTAQAQAHLAMGGWPYAGLPFYGLYAPGGQAPPEGVANGDRAGGGGGLAGGSAPSSPAGLAQLMMQLQLQAMSQLQTQADSLQGLRQAAAQDPSAGMYLPPDPSGQPSGSSVRGGESARQDAVAGTSEEPEGASPYVMDSEGATAPSAEDQERETLRRRRLQRYEGESSSAAGSDT